MSFLLYLCSDTTEDERKIKQMATISSTKINNFDVRGVSAFYGNLLTEVSKLHNGKCPTKAKTCEIPVKNGSRLLGWRNGCCAGTALDLVELARAKLGFSYSLYIVVDGKWGSKVNGSWNGMIRDVVDGKADILMQNMNLMRTRAEDVEFTPAYGETTSFGILRIKGNAVELPNWGFLEPITLEIKIAIMLACIIAIGMITIFENARFLTKSKPAERFSVQEAMTYIFGLTFQRDMGGINPRMWSGRLVALGYASAMTIIMSIYTARITANSIEKIVDDGFKGFDDEKVNFPYKENNYLLIRLC